MKKSKFNLAVDVFMFTVMMAIAGIGFLIKYVLVPGSVRNEVYGRNVDLYFWGIDRHQWVSIHLILAYILLFLLLVHLVFHWKQIVCIFKSMVPVKAGRILITTTICLLSIVLGIVPLFLNPDVQMKSTHLGGNQYKNEIPLTGPKSGAIEKTTETQESPQTVILINEHNNIEVFGYMTLDEVAEKYNVSVIELANFIKVPEQYTKTRLGRLKKKYKFEMHDLKEYIASITTQQ